MPGVPGSPGVHGLHGVAGGPAPSSGSSFSGFARSFAGSSDVAADFLGFEAGILRTISKGSIAFGSAMVRIVALRSSSRVGGACANAAETLHAKTPATNTGPSMALLLHM